MLAAASQHRIDGALQPDPSLDRVDSAASYGCDAAAAPTIFPPILVDQSQICMCEEVEEPALCKSIVYVQPARSLTTPIDESSRRASEESKPSRRSTRSAQNSDNYCDKIVSSVWEEANDMQEEMARRQEMATELQAARNPCWVIRSCKFRQKLRSYGKEWTQGFGGGSRGKVIEASVRAGCANVVWSLVLGVWMEEKTRGKLGTTELLVANAVCGSLFQLLGGYGVLIVGGSCSPLLVFIVASSLSAHHLQLDFVSWMCWIGLWSSLFLLLLAASHASKFITSHITFFTYDVLSVFVALTLLWSALQQIAHFLDNSTALDSAFLSLWLATTAFFVACFLENTRRSPALDRQIRDTIADYGPLLSIFVFTAISQLPKLTQPKILQVSLPQSGYHTDQVSRLGCIRLRILPVWAILLAVIPGIMLAGVVFICHNATSALLQEKAGSKLVHKNCKGWDLCIVAMLTFLCSLFGLPYSCGLLYQSTVHVRALTLKLHEYADMENQNRLVSKVAVQRISGLVASIFSALPLLPPVRWIVGKIPLAVLTGLFLQLACQGLRDWKIVGFISAFFNGYQRRTQTRFSIFGIFMYSAAQMSCIFAVFIVSKTPAAILFPLFIFATFWVRHYAMRGLFRQESFAKFDTKLVKEYSDISSTEPSIGSPGQVTRSQAAEWPQLQIQVETLGSAMSAPMGSQVVTRREPDSSESPMPRTISPYLLTTTNRRLKERCRRRHKRKRPTSFETDGTENMYSGPQNDLPIPPLVKAMMQEDTSMTKEVPCHYEEDTRIDLSKRVSPRLSPQFFKKLKQKSGGQTPLEVHSNLLYEPKRANAARDKLALSSEDSQRLAAEERDDPSTVRAEQTEDKLQCPTISIDASTAVIIAPCQNEIEIADWKTQNEDSPMTRSSVAANNQSPARTEKQEIVFQGSPGIGRCIRSPTFKPKNETRRRARQLQFSLSVPRRKAPLKEDFFPSNVRCGHDHTESGGWGSMLSYSGLRKCRTSKWPTTSSQQKEVRDHVSQQRFAAS